MRYQSYQYMHKSIYNNFIPYIVDINHVTLYSVLVKLAHLHSRKSSLYPPANPSSPSTLHPQSTPSIERLQAGL